MRAFPFRVSAVAAKIAMSAIIAVLCFGAALAQSQVSSADLNGTVVDPNGAVVAGASVTARDAATGFSRTVTTDDSGVYRFIGLPPSDYEVTVEAANFKKTVISPVKLTVGQTAELEVKLEIGATGAIVNITGDSVELVESSRTALSNTIEQQRIENLPIN